MCAAHGVHGSWHRVVSVPVDEIIRLLVTCADRPGIVAAVSSFLYERGANIVDAEQHATGDRFFLRVEAEVSQELEADFAVLAAEFQMDWRLARRDPEKRVAILVSRVDHCLLDLLWRFEQGELEGRPALVVSNHTDLEPRAAHFDLPFHHVPTGDKEEAERQMLDVLAEADLVVLARYMQILSDDFLERLGAPAINIHHSFLPAFAGANPYDRALERGVKVIGATAHYVTAELDEGPIIEQDVARVSHRDSRADLVRIGRDIERLVLARAVKWHLEDRVLVDGARTVVFR
jgi:formyltetrahydrofolate deformylase